MMDPVWNLMDWSKPCLMRPLGWTEKDWQTLKLNFHLAADELSDMMEDWHMKEEIERLCKPMNEEYWRIKKSNEA